MEIDYKSHFKKLEEDFRIRMAEKEKKKKEDEVRFRVIGDPQITYEQYSEMLKGAHLKPIKKGDTTEMTQAYKRKVTYTDYDN